MILGILTPNSLIAIGESAVHRHLVPYTVADGVEVVEEIFRSTALLGHPLTNAIITASTIFMLLDLDRPVLRVVLIGLFCVALLTFGGRAAFVTVTLVLTVFLAIKAVAGLAASRYSYLQILGGLLGTLILLALFLAFIFVSGFGERIFTHLYIDDSAAVRADNWLVFSYMSPGEILFGLAPQNIEHVMIRMGLNFPLESIENPWIYMSMQFGMLGLGLVLLSLATICWWLARRSGVGGCLALMVFFIVASTYNSIAAKSYLLTVLFVSLVSLTGFASAPRTRRSGDHVPSVAKPRPGRREVHA
jgi:hypothetical protein